jgi:RNA polymerase sigma-70 factor (ECF subfamily)
MERTAIEPQAVDADADLMWRYGAGDAAAFEALYARHKGALYRYFLRQCRHASLADELFQETWFKVVRARESYRPAAKFATWLFAIAHNVLMDNFRRHTITVVDGEAAEAELANAESAPHERPERQFDRKRRIEKLLQLLEALPALQREAFLMHEEAELSLAEIAAATGANEETVKSRLRYALAKLRAGMVEDSGMTQD